VIINRSIQEGNKAEAQIVSQIILISSAVLVIVGVFVVNPDLKHISRAAGSILLIAVGGLGLSLLAGVFHFVVERSFWYQNAKTDGPVIKTNGPSQIPLWSQVLLFTLGMLALIILVLSQIKAKMG
jgi:hypothetical protein